MIGDLPPALALATALVTVLVTALVTALVTCSRELDSRVPAGESGWVGISALAPATCGPRGDGAVGETGFWGIARAGGGVATVRFICISSLGWRRPAYNVSVWMGCEVSCVRCRV